MGASVSKFTLPISIDRIKDDEVVSHLHDRIFCDHIVIDHSEKVGEPIEVYNAYKEKISQISPGDSHQTIIDNDPAKKNTLSLDQQQISILVQLARKMREDFEVGYNIEFIFDERGILWLLDAVPLSVHRNLKKIGESD